jgi:hypothetical protein
MAEGMGTAVVTFKATSHAPAYSIRTDVPQKCLDYDREKVRHRLASFWGALMGDPTPAVQFGDEMGQLPKENECFVCSDPACKFAYVVTVACKLPNPPATGRSVCPVCGMPTMSMGDATVLAMKAGT